MKSIMETIIIILLILILTAKVTIKVDAPTPEKVGMFVKEIKEGFMKGYKSKDQ